MAINAIGASLGVTQAGEQRGLGSLNSEDFFSILVTELQNQDPFEPAKTEDMISQVAQIRDIELSGQLTDTLSQLTAQQRMNGCSALIGKYVQAITLSADGAASVQEGVVTGIQFGQDGRALLELDTGEAILATSVVRVTTLEQVESNEQNSEV